MLALHGKRDFTDISKVTAFMKRSPVSLLESHMSLNWESLSGSWSKGDLTVKETAEDVTLLEKDRERCHESQNVVGF